MSSRGKHWAYGNNLSSSDNISDDNSDDNSDNNSDDRVSNRVCNKIKENKENRIKELEERVKKLEEMVLAMWDAPGMPGFNQITDEVNKKLRNFNFEK